MSDDDTGKITLAVLSQQILTLTQQMSALTTEMRALNNGVTDYRILQSKHDQQIVNLGQDLDNLSTRVNGWSVLNSAGVVFAAIVGVVFGNRQP
jgi:hypothetical protein